MQKKIHTHTETHVPYSSSRDVKPPKGGAHAEANCLASEDANADSKSCSSVSSSSSSSSSFRQDGRAMQSHD